MAAAPQGAKPKPGSVFKDFSKELNARRLDKLKKGFLITPDSAISTMQSTLYIKAGNPWLLEHRSNEPGKPLVGEWLPAGEYRLTFTSHSKALEAIAIDPDPDPGRTGPIK